MAGCPNSEEAERIGSRIKNKREGLGLAQLELALRVGTSASAINEYEHGKRRPSRNTLQRLADALDSTVAELRGEIPDSDVVVAKGEERELLLVLHMLNESNYKSALHAMKAMAEGFLSVQEGSKIKTTEYLERKQ